MKYFLFFIGFFLLQLNNLSAQYGCLAGDCASDYGVYVWENGDRYAGEFENHQLNGYGVYTFKEGSVYSGMFTNGQREGFGRLEWKSGDVYLGVWEGGRRSGFGKMMFRNGTVQEGEWQNDRLVSNASMQEGCIDGDCLNDVGIFAWKSGDFYYGSFTNGRIDGQGVYLYRDGSIYAGSFNNGTCEGEGIYYAVNGGRYIGDFKQCYFHGEGTYNFPDGAVQEGRWQNGKFLEETTQYSAEEYFNMAYKAETHQEKVRLYTKAIELRPNFSMAYNNRAWSYMSMGQHQSALSDCNQALRYNSSNKHALHTRGMVYFRLGKYQSAIDDYGRALKIDPDYTAAIRDRQAAVNKLYQQRPQDNTPPLIAITSPQVRGSKVVTKGEKIRVQGKVTDASGVQNLLINGYDVRLNSPGAKSSTFSVDLTLSQGQNQFWAIAGDVHGNKSAKTSFTIERQSESLASTPSTGQSGVRTALVIGNADYLVGPLGSQPINDARDMAKALREVGFEVLLFTDLQTRAQMKDAVRQYSDKIKSRGGVGLVYYAGHGMQVGGENYLMPTKATPQQEIDVEDEGLRMSWLLAQAEQNNNNMNILVLDACRNNPFARSWRSGSSGLAGVNSAPMGTFIAFATSPNSVASNGIGRNGLYTQELLKAMRKPGLTIEQVFKQVRFKVSQESNEMQIPWENSSIIGDFYFKK